MGSAAGRVDTGLARSPVEAAPTGRRLVVWALVGVLVASAWAGLWVRSEGHPVALVGPGNQGPAWPLLEREIGFDLGWDMAGHDGGMFYAVARSPLHPERAVRWLDVPAYRERRILFPLVAGLLAPGGGMPLVYAMLAVSLLGVGLGTAAVASLPRRRRRWLPIVVALTPGVLASVLVGLSDALVVGLILAAFACSYRQRWGWMLVALVLAVLTRETALLAVAGLACAPGMARRVRVATVVLPTVALASWMAWLHVVLPRSGDPKAAEQFTWPLMGWIGAEPSALFLGGCSALVLALALRRLRAADRHVGVFVGITLAMSVVLSADVTDLWVNASRIVAPALPLALWIVFGERAMPELAADPVVDAAAQAARHPQLVGS